jgi:asparagine N-glycosylation enzyme membrane subunit Stt3
MAASWGAYVFISNLIPLYVLVMIAIRRYHRRLYVAYTTFWAIGGLLAMQVGFDAAHADVCCWESITQGVRASCSA